MALLASKTKGYETRDEGDDATCDDRAEITSRAIENEARGCGADQSGDPHGRIEISDDGADLARAEQIGSDCWIQADAAAIAHAERQCEQCQLDHA